MTPEDFRKNLANRLNELWNPHNEVDRPNKLYHYTSLAGLRGILASRQIWITDIGSLRNDPRDGLYYATVIPNVLRRKSVPPRVVDYFSQGEVMMLGGQVFAYVASFSARRNLGSQWQEFADAGRGAAIEVNFDAIFRDGATASDYALMKMMYDRKVQEAKLVGIIDYAIHQLREFDLSSKAKESYWAEILTPLLVCGAFFKNPSYASEQEWRVWKLRPDRSTGAERPGSNGTKIWYETLHLTDEIVSRIVLGPRCELGVSDALELAQSAALPAVRVFRITHEEMI
jgi:hypothetical protein